MLQRTHRLKAPPCGNSLSAVGETSDVVCDGPNVVMVKPVGPVCNLRCEYCYYVDKTTMFPVGERYRMTNEVLETTIRSFLEASSGPSVHFVWHGGEPTLAGIDFYRRALELQRRYLPSGWECRNSIQTNGTLIDDRWARFIAENEIGVGLSLDGPPAIHDRGRPDRHRRGSHARAVRGFATLREHGVDSDVLCTVNARTAAAPRGVYRYFVNLGVRWLQFIPVVRRVGEDADEISVRPDAYGAFLTTIFDEWVRYDVEHLTIQEFMIPMLVAMGRPPQLCVASATCGQVLAVEHDGGIYSCDHFVDPAHHLGDVRGHGVLAAFTSPAQRAFGAAKAEVPSACAECDVLVFCRGGCPKDRFGPAAASTNYLCEGYREFYRHALPYVTRMATLALTGRRPSSIAAELAVAERESRRMFREAGRNHLCPCGSGRKYKQCCYRTRRR